MSYNLALEFKLRSRAELVVESFLMIVITLTALFGNLMVCVVVFRNKSLHTIPNIYVVSLAISDILMASFCMSFSIEALITSNWTEPAAVCQFQGFFCFFFAFTSLQTMTCMAINRYYRVVKPSLYNSYFSSSRAIASVGIVVVSASFGAGLQLASNWSVFIFHFGKVICFPSYRTPDIGKGYMAFIDLCYIFLPVLVISICYFKIFVTVRHHKKTLFTVKENGSTAQERVPKFSINVEEVKITKTLFVTVLGFIICWTPIAIIDLIETFAYNSIAIPRQVYLLYIYLGFGSSSINPFIYGILNRSFRNEFLKILRLKSNNQIQTTQNSNKSHFVRGTVELENSETVV